MSDITPLDALLALGETEVVSSGIPTNETEYTSMIYRTDGVAISYTWSQVSAKMSELNANKNLTNLRKERNSKLKDTDFYALSDVTMSSEMTTYRQALRDLPDNYTTSDSSELAEDLSNLVWPTKP